LGATPVPALGLSRAFDSLNATMRLAVNTGMAEELKEFTDSGKYLPLAGPPAEEPKILGEMRREHGWTHRDKVIFAASVTGATIVGAIIVFA
jgi:hypothetical protein